jgi:imidazole glycerol-phosphate synthase subunit HisH
MIAVIDYKAGNLTSVMKALEALGQKATVTADPAQVRRAGKVILPGVGHFQATQLLEETGLTAAVREVIDQGVPFLGICVGLQWLFEGSTEAPDVRGLGALPGNCERFPSSVKVPHVGWNSIRIQNGIHSEGTNPEGVNPGEVNRAESKLMRGIPDGSFVYYTHSYRPPVVEATVAITEYGGGFSGAVERGNVMGVQFHPEKSGEAGMRLLRNFVELRC